MGEKENRKFAEGPEHNSHMEAIAVMQQYTMLQQLLLLKPCQNKKGRKFVTVL